ncbi:MAG: S-layer homology domain-containing protein [Clostridia bacterium]|nr:S-layer homology domain-containing protein [Clostridia bacterium]
MNKTWKKRVGAFMLAALFVLVGAIPVFAEKASAPIELILEDVTDSDATVLSGQAKLKVSVKGTTESVYGVQTTLSFFGDLSYSSVQFLQGENDPASGSFQVSQNPADVNLDMTVAPSILSKNAFDFSDKTDLFILTFTGEPGETIEVTLDESETKSYFTVDHLTEGRYIGVDAETETISLTASSKQGGSIDATIRLEMDALQDIGFKSNFDGSEPYYKDPGVCVEIIGEENSTNLKLFLSDLHRVTSANVPTFEIRTQLLAESNYTVKVTGMGFAPYTVEGVDFATVLTIGNTKFVPGDVDGNEVVDGYDKALFNLIVESEEYNEAADFNRDGKVNNNDFSIIAHLPDVEIGGDDNEEEDPEKPVPAKMEKPNLSATTDEIEVEWELLDEDEDTPYPVTGYEIHYGTTAEMKNVEEVDDPEETKFTLEDLEEDTKYYVCIAAVNENGRGEFSKTASISTKETSSGGGGGGGTGGGGGGGGAGGGGGSTGDSRPSAGTGTGTGTGTGSGSGDVAVDPVDPKEPFTDLGNYSWAKESIYSLKDAGIISGTSETTYSPAANIKRGDFILILSRMLKLEDAFTENFADVPESSYYYNAIGAAKVAGIAKGDSETNTFRPEDTITRQDLITLAYRAFLDAGYIEATEDVSALDQFADKDLIAGYAAEAMASMVSAGIIKGSDGNVNPLGNATRAEVAVMCARLAALMK